jgi:hypothetical protein
VNERAKEGDANGRIWSVDNEKPRVSGTFTYNTRYPESFQMAIST